MHVARAHARHEARRHLADAPLLVIHQLDQVWDGAHVTDGGLSLGEADAGESAQALQDRHKSLRAPATRGEQHRGNRRSDASLEHGVACAPRDAELLAEREGGALDVGLGGSEEHGERGHAPAVRDLLAALVVEAQHGEQLEHDLLEREIRAREAREQREDGAAAEELAPVVGLVLAEVGEHLARGLLQLVARPREDHVEERGEAADGPQLVSARLCSAECGDRTHRAGTGLGVGSFPEDPQERGEQRRSLQQLPMPLMREHLREQLRRGSLRGRRARLEQLCEPLGHLELLDGGGDAGVGELGVHRRPVRQRLQTLLPRRLRLLAHERHLLGEADGVATLELVEARVAHAHRLNKAEGGDLGGLLADVSDEDLTAVTAVVLPLHHRELALGEEAMRRGLIRRPVFLFAHPMLVSGAGGAGAWRWRLVLGAPLCRELTRQLRVAVQLRAPSRWSGGGGGARDADAARSTRSRMAGIVPGGALVDVVNVEGATSVRVAPLFPA